MATVQLPVVNQEQAKVMAKNLKKAFSQEGVDLSVTQAQHILSKTFGCSNFQTLMGRKAESSEAQAIAAFELYCADYPGSDLAYLLEPLVKSLFNNSKSNRSFALNHLQDVVNMLHAEKHKKSDVLDDYVDTGLEAFASFIPQSEDRYGDIIRGDEEYAFDIAPQLLSMKLATLKSIKDWTEDSDAFAVYCPEYINHDGPYEVLVEDAIDDLIGELMERFEIFDEDSISQKHWDAARRGQFDLVEEGGEFLCGLVDRKRHNERAPIFIKLCDTNLLADGINATSEFKDIYNLDIPFIFSSTELERTYKTLSLMDPREGGVFALCSQVGGGSDKIEVVDFEGKDMTNNYVMALLDEMTAETAQTVFGVYAHVDIVTMLDDLERILGKN